jgi:hypothetical protein
MQRRMRNPESVKGEGGDAEKAEAAIEISEQLHGLNGSKYPGTSLTGRFPYKTLTGHNKTARAAGMSIGYAIAHGSP